MTRDESAGHAVRIAGLGYWSTGYAGLDAWRTGTADAELVRPAATSLKPRDRRRASFLGRALADASFEALSNTPASRSPGAEAVSPAEVHLVVGSAIAEAATLLGMLEQTMRYAEPLSPAAFTMSVHNASSGLMSISYGNRGFATSLAADADTPAACLMEGIGLALTSDLPVLVACGDEASPDGLVPESERWDLLAAALVLLPPGHPAPGLATLRVQRSEAITLEPAAFDERVARNPQVGLADLVMAVLEGREGALALDRGDGRGYSAVLAPTGLRQPSDG